MKSKPQQPLLTMQNIKKRSLSFIIIICIASLAFITKDIKPETSSGWEKFKGNPVLGGEYGTIFDVSLIKEKDVFKMWNSWRPKKSIALCESKDGKTWSPPVIALSDSKTSGWETDVNRPVVVKKDGIYHMWYTGQTWINGRDGRSCIGYATSLDGKKFTKKRDTPVLIPDLAWEKNAVMCPHVLWDVNENIFKMWYSAGEQYEPDAIGYATSKDGINWIKERNNPIFRNDTSNEWEKAKVTACQVIKMDSYYVMFYIGFHDIDFAQIGIAKSLDGISNWKRHPENPIISPGKGWDASACYKPYAILVGDIWYLWYNGRHDSFEQIGLALHKGKELGFDKK